MNVFVLAKKEMNLLKWVLLGALLVIIRNLVVFNHVVGSRFGGIYITELNNFYRGDNPFFGDTIISNIPFFYILVVVLAISQFYGLNNTFLFSLPIKKSKVIGMKVACGIGLYSVSVLTYGIGLISIFLKNRYWLESIYSYVPMEAYHEIVKRNSVGYILQYLFILWLALTAAYALAVFLQIVFKNKLFAGAVSVVVLWYPSFFHSYLNRGIYEYFNRNKMAEFNMEKYYAFTQALDRIKLFSLPESQVFESLATRESFVSKVNGINEMSYFPYIYTMVSYWPKVLMAVSVILLFMKLVFSCYQSGYISEERDMVVFPYMRNTLLWIASIGAGLIFACFILIQLKSVPAFFVTIPVASVIVYLTWILCLKKWNTDKGVKR